MSWSYERWVAWIERRRRWILVGSILLCVVSALSLRRLRFDFDILSMLPQGRPAFDEFKTFVADFGQLNELIVLVDGAPAIQLRAFADAFAPRVAGLDTVISVQARIDVAPILDGVLGRFVYNYLPRESYAELAARLTPEGLDAQAAVNRAILSAPFDLSAADAIVHDPFGLRRFAALELAKSATSETPGLDDGYVTSADGGALLVLIRPRASAFDTTFTERLMRQVREAEAATRAAQPGSTVRISYAGSYAYALEDAATLRRDTTRYVVLAFVGVLLVFYAGYRNLRVVPFVAYPLVVSTLISFALSLILFEQLNAVSTSFAAILYGLSIDSAIHFYTRFMQEERRRRDVRASITTTLAALARPTLASSGTTAIVFAVIGLSDLSAVRQLGSLTSIGMLLTIVEFFVLYPALAFFLSGPSADRLQSFDTPNLGRLAGGCVGWARPVVVATVVLSAVGIWSASRVGIDVTLPHLRPRASEAVRVEEEIAAKFGRIGSGGAVLLRAPEVERALVDGERVAERLATYQADGMLESVSTVAGILPSMQRQRERLALYNGLPRAVAADGLRAALVRHGFVAERFDAFFADFRRPRDEVLTPAHPALAPLSFLIEHFVRRAGNEYVVAVYVQPAAGVAMPTVADRLRADLADMSFAFASRELLEDELGRVVGGEFRLFLALALIGNVVLLLATFRRVSLAMVVLLPCVLAVVGVFAAMSLGGIALDPVNLVVVPLILGVGVDFSVYVTAGALEWGSSRLAIDRGGRALVETGLTTIAGFGFLAFSRYPPLSSMGLLCGIGLTLSVVLAMTVLPSLLALVGVGWSATSQN